MSRPWIALKAIIYATLFLAIWGSVAFLFHRLDAHIPLQVPVWLRVPGIVVGLCGAVLSLSTIELFIFKGRGTPALFDPPKKFVPHGPYKFLRNPMYVGGVAMLLGLGFYLTSVGIVLFAVMAFLLIHTFVVRAEEPGLRKRFGQEYHDYCRAVPRWVPRFSGPRPRP